MNHVIQQQVTRGPARFPEALRTEEESLERLARTLPDRTRREVSKALLKRWRTWLERIGAPPAAHRSLERLGEGAFVVATGQQAGLLGGPLLTWVKAGRAVAVARELAEASGQPVVPVFWIADDDHDHGEIHHTYLRPPRGELTRHLVDIPASRQPVSHLAAPDPVALAGVAQALGEEELPEPFRPRSGEAWGHWFARLLAGALGDEGLLVFTPALLGEEMRPLAEQTLADPARLERALQRGAETLSAHGLEPLLAVDSTPPWFVIRSDGRHRVLAQDDRFRVAGDLLRLEELLDHARLEEPRLSANVATRALLQDAVLPVVAFIAGPSERIYLAQLRDTHEELRIPCPAVLPRPSLTIFPHHALRVLRKLGTSPIDLLRGPLPEAPSAPDLLEAHDRLARSLRSHLQEIAGHSPELGQATRRRADQIARQWDLLREQVARVLEQGVQREAARREGLLTLVRPRGQPQDRVLNLLSFHSELPADWAQRMAALPGGEGLDVLWLLEGPRDG